MQHTNPASLLTKVRFLGPVTLRALIRFSGIPTSPNPVLQGMMYVVLQMSSIGIHTCMYYTVLL